MLGTALGLPQRQGGLWAGLSSCKAPQGRNKGAAVCPGLAVLLHLSLEDLVWPQPSGPRGPPGAFGWEAGASSFSGLIPQAQDSEPKPPSQGRGEMGAGRGRVRDRARRRPPQSDPGGNWDPQPPPSVTSAGSAAGTGPRDPRLLKGQSRRLLRLVASAQGGPPLVGRARWPLAGASVVFSSVSQRRWEH